MTESEKERLGASYTWQELDSLLERLSSEPIELEFDDEGLEALLQELSSEPLELDFDDTVCPFCGRPYEGTEGQRGSQKDKPEGAKRL
jgi:hypothetical protein